jgi:hypothetical protein
MVPQDPVAAPTLRRSHKSSWWLLLPAIGWLWLLVLLLAGLLGFAVRRHHFESAGIAFGIGFAVFAVLVGRGQWPGSPRTLRHSWVAAGVPVAVAILAFGWSVGLGPLSDDFVLQGWARSGDWAPAEWSYLRPLPLALWQATIAAGGGWGALHAINVSVHAINSGLVASLAAGWVGPRAGLVAGVVFALFPASTEAVAWTAGVFDVMATLFILLAAIVWVRCAASPQRTIALILCCLAGFLSKELAIVIPAILALIAVIAPPGERRERRLQAWPLVLTASAVWGLLVARVLWSTSLAGHLDNLPGDRREWKDMIVRPFAGLAVPVRTEAGISVEAYLVSLAVLVVLGAVLVQIGTGRSAADRSPAESGQFAALAIGVAWIGISAFPLLLQFYVSPTLEGSRYLYLPAVGFSVALSACFAGRMRPLTIVPAIGLLLLLSIDIGALRNERGIWRQAANTRDALIAQAEATVRAVPCRTLDVLDAPDNFRGAFVFREGLPEAISDLPYDNDGVACIVRWTGAALVAVEPGHIP